MAGACVAFFALVALASALLVNDLLDSLALQRTIAWSTFALSWFVLAAGTTAAVRQRTREIRYRWREQARYKLSDNALIRHLPEEADVVIRFDEIVRITESALWLNVSANTGWRISIPRDVARYDELRSALANYVPIRPVVRSSRNTVIALSVACVTPLCIALMVLTTSSSVRNGAAAVLVATLTLTYLVLPLLSVLRRKRQPTA